MRRMLGRRGGVAPSAASATGRHHRTNPATSAVFSGHRRAGLRQPAVPGGQRRPAPGGAVEAGLPGGRSQVLRADHNSLIIKRGSNTGPVSDTSASRWTATALTRRNAAVCGAPAAGFEAAHHPVARRVGCGWSSEDTAALLKQRTARAERGWPMPLAEACSGWGGSHGPNRLGKSPRVAGLVEWGLAEAIYRVPPVGCAGANP